MAAVRKKQVSFRDINNWIHLWLGLISGVIMLIVCFTACLWVFQREITDMIVPRQEQEYIIARNAAVVSPSRVVAVADSLFPKGLVRRVVYERERPVVFHLDLPIVDTVKKNKPIQGLVNPYSGMYMGTIKELNKEEEELRKGVSAFFGWAIRGHRAIWLPWDIGRPIVNYGTLVFTVTLITGLVWWYPKKWNRSTRDKSFKVKWRANWKRVNLDLHNVFGFYSLLVVLALALTGMVYGINWYSKALFWTTNWGESLPDWKPQDSDTTMRTLGREVGPILDREMAGIMSKHQDFFRFSLYMPDTANAKSAYAIYADKYRDRYYGGQSYVFDQYTGKRILNNISLYNKQFHENTVGEQIYRMNYDIHVGSVLGLPTKILAFFASFIGATLPVTGFIIWYNRKWGKKKTSTKRMKKGASLPESSNDVSDKKVVPHKVRLRQVNSSSSSSPKA
ncbi:PepSY-associated TM helix domain-containing protein [Sphingobacterium sp. LRF_L2]|uniref:PepSY-associated TM helix domain-containing protein n=1 Tax=Sphingobacterium sp. LRF_L2 TaxID=3369421 RepID=UPI003F5E5D51